MGLGTKVIGFDLRKATSPVVRLFDDETASKTIMEAQDEINQIVLAEQLQKRGPPSLHLAAADDSGVVQVIDMMSPLNGKEDSVRELLHCPERSSMVTSAVFRPRSRNLELASGGTDCQICLWDVNKAK